MQPPGSASAELHSDPGLGPALLSPQPQPLAPPATQGQFVAVTGSEPSTSAETMLVTAYTLMWVLVLGFVYYVFRQQRKLRARLAQLEKTLERAESADRESSK
jgi:CcmD family protein